MMYVDPNGEFFWIVVAAFAAGNVLAQAMGGHINDFDDFFQAAINGALAGAAIGGAFVGLTAMAASSVGLVSTAGKIGVGAMKTYAYAQTAIAGLGLVGASVQAIDQGSWRPLGNWGKLTLGNFYLDENGDEAALPRWMQGLLRHTWEAPQQFAGHGWGQIRNSNGKVSRVDYLGGATFATDENAGYRNGLSLGSFINMNYDEKIKGDFTDHVLSSQLYMHEYGHTRDSRRHGWFYLPTIGLSSVKSFSNDRPLNDGSGLSTHDIFWTERRANRDAANYFKRYYDYNWNASTYPVY
jgi:hypothetical protein